MHKLLVDLLHKIAEELLKIILQRIFERNPILKKLMDESKDKLLELSQRKSLEESLDGILGEY